MSVIPSWAPNLHPLVIHFPIVLVIVAAIIDVVDVVLERPSWLGAAATSLYLAGTVAAIAAYLTGTQAGESVLIPGMAHPVLTAHSQWALATMWYFVFVSGLRIVVRRARVARTRPWRLLLLAAGVAGIVLMQQTAERGARLVYEFGTGVMSVPGQR